MGSGVSVGSGVNVRVGFSGVEVFSIFVGRSVCVGVALVGVPVELGDVGVTVGVVGGVCV